MNSSPLSLAALFRECEKRGIELRPTNDGCVAINGPKSDLTPELLEVLRTRKPEILLVLHAELELDQVRAPAARQEFAAKPRRPANTACRCGSTEWKDTPIHDGQSIRRDCRRCGRFLGFPQWYGRSGAIAAEGPAVSHKEATDD